jgi:hypothetical protein
MPVVTDASLMIVIPGSAPGGCQFSGVRCQSTLPCSFKTLARLELWESIAASSDRGGDRIGGVLAMGATMPSFA